MQQTNFNSSSGLASSQNPYHSMLAELHALTNPSAGTLPPMPGDAWVGSTNSAAPSVQPAVLSPTGLFDRLRQFVDHLLHPTPQPAPAPTPQPSPAPAPQPAPAPAPIKGSGPLLRHGTHGAPVRALQTRLKELGFDPGPIDGDFGPKTKAAVTAFQRSRHIEADGIVGPVTWGQLGIKVEGEVTYGPPGAVAATPISGNPTEVAQRFIDSAKRFLGIPYLYGGGHSGYMSKPGRVDCSGLVLQAAHMAGFNLDGCAADQQRRGRAVSMNELKPGDLVFRGMPAHHVGIYLGNGQVIHAPQTGDVVKISNVSYFQNARRVLG